MYTSLNGLWNVINSSTVQTNSFSNMHTMSTFDNVSGIGLKLSFD